MADPKKLPDAEHFVNLEKQFKILCGVVFSSGSGKDLLDQLRRIYCDGKLYQEKERDTVYCLGQRDLIMELVHNSKGDEQ